MQQLFESYNLFFNKYHDLLWKNFDRLKLEKNENRCSETASHENCFCPLFTKNLPDNDFEVKEIVGIYYSELSDMISALMGNNPLMIIYSIYRIRKTLDKYNFSIKEFIQGSKSPFELEGLFRE